MGVSGWELSKAHARLISEIVERRNRRRRERGKKLLPAKRKGIGGATKVKQHTKTSSDKSAHVQAWLGGGREKTLSK